MDVHMRPWSFRFSQQLGEPQSRYLPFFSRARSPPSAASCAGAGFKLCWSSLGAVVAMV